MRISDWSSDVCSSDLLLSELPAAKGCGIDISAAAVEQAAVNAARLDFDARARFLRHSWTAGLALEGTSWDVTVSNPPYIASGEIAGLAPERSEERRVGKECVSTCRSWLSPYP